MTVISVDLAYKRYSDIGIAVLHRTVGAVECTFVDPDSEQLNVSPTPESVAHYLVDLCEKYKATLLMIDGPQGWKSPTNGLQNSRQCERELNTPAKTGLPDVVKPRNYTSFVTFSINVFDCLHQLGWPRLQELNPMIMASQSVAVETFPLAAWRKLAINPLPAKRKATAKDIQVRQNELQQRFGLNLSTIEISHDQLQALVAGLAGIAIEANEPEHYLVCGTSPVVIDNLWREGFIVVAR
jgi:hypothetical protein